MGAPRCGRLAASKRWFRCAHVMSALLALAASSTTSSALPLSRDPARGFPGFKGIPDLSRRDGHPVPGTDGRRHEHESTHLHPDGSWTHFKYSATLHESCVSLDAWRGLIEVTGCDGKGPGGKLALRFTAKGVSSARTRLTPGALLVGSAHWGCSRGGPKHTQVARRITAPPDISRDADGSFVVRLTSDPAPFHHCFEHLSLRLHHEPVRGHSPGNMTVPEPVVQQEHAAAAERRLLWGFERRKTWDLLNANYDPNRGRAARELISTSWAKCENCYFYIKLGLTIELDVEWLTVKNFKCIVHGDAKAQLEAVVDPPQELSYTAWSSKLSKYLGRLPIVNYGIGALGFSLATIHFGFEVSSDLSWGVSADASDAMRGTLTANIEAHAYARIGAEYDSYYGLRKVLEAGWTKYSSIDNTLELGTAEAVGKMKAELTLSFYPLDWEMTHGVIPWVKATIAAGTSRPSAFPACQGWWEPAIRLTYGIDGETQTTDLTTPDDWYWTVGWGPLSKTIDWTDKTIADVDSHSTNTWLDERTLLEPTCLSDLVSALAGAVTEAVAAALEIVPTADELALLEKEVARTYNVVAGRVRVLWDSAASKVVIEIAPSATQTLLTAADLAARITSDLANPMSALMGGWLSSVTTSRAGDGMSATISMLSPSSSEYFLCADTDYYAIASTWACTEKEWKFYFFKSHVQLKFESNSRCLDAYRSAGAYLYSSCEAHDGGSDDQFWEITSSGQLKSRNQGSSGSYGKCLERDTDGKLVYRTCDPNKWSQRLRIKAWSRIYERNALNGLVKQKSNEAGGNFNYNPFFGNVPDVQARFLYLAADLSKGGVPSGTQISGMTFFGKNPGSVSVSNLRYAYSWKPDTEVASGLDGVVLDSADFTTFWHRTDSIAPFGGYSNTVGVTFIRGDDGSVLSWDGTNNLVLEMSHDQSSATRCGVPTYVYLSFSGYSYISGTYNWFSPSTPCSSVHPEVYKLVSSTNKYLFYFDANRHWIITDWSTLSSCGNNAYAYLAENVNPEDLPSSGWKRHDGNSWVSITPSISTDSSCGYMQLVQADTNGGPSNDRGQYRQFPTGYSGAYPFDDLDSSTWSTSGWLANHVPDLELEFCVPGFYGQDCDRFCRANETCSSRGSCSDAGDCMCDDGYSGTSCEVVYSACDSWTLLSSTETASAYWNGTIDDGSSGSGLYGHLANCMWGVQLRGAKGARLTIDRMSIERNYDLLHFSVVYHNASADQWDIEPVFTLTGNLSDAETALGDGATTLITLPPNMEGMDSGFLLHFESDGKVRSTGWSVRWEALYCMPLEALSEAFGYASDGNRFTTKEGCTCQPGACHGTWCEVEDGCGTREDTDYFEDYYELYEGEYWDQVVSPGCPSVGPPPRTCSWQIEPVSSTPVHKVQVIYSLTCDLAGAGSPSSVSVSGEPGTSIHSADCAGLEQSSYGVATVPGPIALVELQMTAGSETHFDMAYASVFCEGSTDIVEPYGELNDGSADEPGYWLTSGQACSWSIVPDGAAYVAIELTRLDIAYTDELLVFDGASTEAPQVHSLAVAPSTRSGCKCTSACFEGGWCETNSTCGITSDDGSALRRLLSSPRWAAPNTKDKQQQRIIGGSTVKPAFSYPWLLALLLDASPHQGPNSTSHDFQICGASLLAPGWAVTAAHCVFDDPSPSHYSIEARRHNLTKSAAQEGAPFRVNVSEVIMHPQYNNDNYLNDIALLRLSTPIDTSDFGSSTLELDDGTYSADGAAVTVAGWGDDDETSWGFRKPKRMRHVDVHIVPHYDCNDAGSYGGSIDEATMLCAGTRGKDACQGDSGGPLFAQKADRPGAYVLVGVVSFGEGCGVRDMPGVYARVSNYTAWIESVAGAGVLPVTDPKPAARWDFCRPYPRFISSSPAVHVQFSGGNLTDIDAWDAALEVRQNNGGASGWEINYVGAFCSGQKNFSADAATLSDGSPTDSPYAPGLACAWLIDVEGAHTIELNFTRLDVFDGDAVRVYDGMSAESGLLLAELTGSLADAAASTLLRSTGQTMLVTFTSDLWFEGTGFQASWQSFRPPPPPLPPPSPPPPSPPPSNAAAFTLSMPGADAAAFGVGNGRRLLQLRALPADMPAQVVAFFEELRATIAKMAGLDSNSVVLGDLSHGKSGGVAVRVQLSLPLGASLDNLLCTLEYDPEALLERLPADLADQVRGGTGPPLSASALSGLSVPLESECVAILSKAQVSVTLSLSGDAISSSGVSEEALSAMISALAEPGGVDVSNVEVAQVDYAVTSSLSLQGVTYSDWTDDPSVERKFRSAVAQQNGVATTEVRVNSVGGSPQPSRHRRLAQDPGTAPLAVDYSVLFNDVMSANAAVSRASSGAEMSTLVSALQAQGLPASGASMTQAPSLTAEVSFRVVAEDSDTVAASLQDAVSSGALANSIAQAAPGVDVLSVSELEVEEAAPLPAELVSPPPPPPPSPPPPQASSGGSDLAVLAGGAVGGVVLVGAAVGTTVYCYRKRRQQREPDAVGSTPQPQAEVPLGKIENTKAAEPQAEVPLGKIENTKAAEQPESVPSVV